MDVIGYLFDLKPSQVPNTAMAEAFVNAAIRELMRRQKAKSAS